jgi:acetyl/propionyl-CoA carboxylase alpha subunit
MNKELLFAGEPLQFRVDTTPDGATISLGETTHEIVIQELSQGRWLLRNSDGQRIVRGAREKDRIWIWLSGKTFDFMIPSDERGAAAHRGAASHEVRAPMPGTLVKLLVSAGDVVEDGQVVAVVEAMKMEHPLRAPRAGSVEATFGTAGSIVDTDAVVVSLVREE